MDASLILQQFEKASKVSWSIDKIKFGGYTHLCKVAHREWQRYAKACKALWTCE